MLLRNARAYQRCFNSELLLLRETRFAEFLLLLLSALAAPLLLLQQASREWHPVAGLGIHFVHVVLRPGEDKLDVAIVLGLVRHGLAQ
jgi:hypothetical protein